VARRRVTETATGALVSEVPPQPIAFVSPSFCVDAESRKLLWCHGRSLFTWAFVLFGFDLPLREAFVPLDDPEAEGGAVGHHVRDCASLVAQARRAV